MFDVAGVSECYCQDKTSTKGTTCAMAGFATIIIIVGWFPIWLPTKPNVIFALFNHRKKDYVTN